MGKLQIHKEVLLTTIKENVENLAIKLWRNKREAPSPSPILLNFNESNIVD